MHPVPSIIDIRQAYERIMPFVHQTPVFTSQTVDLICASRIFFKAENLQKAGAFKARGATNAVLSHCSDEIMVKGEKIRAVATHSSGNHAAALAYAARCRAIKAYVVMPDNAPPVKKAAVADYGAQITYCEPTQQAREQALDSIITETGAVFVHPYNDYRVIAGQATAALELIEQVPGLDALIAPVGGGGLLSGTALAAAALKPGIDIYGAEPGGADDAFRSLEAGQIMPVVDPQTIADGLRTSLGDLTFPIIQKYVKAIITVSEKEIIMAMRLIWERMKLVVEPSAAVALAAVLARNAWFKGKRVGMIVSGGNVDLDDPPWLKGK